MKALHLILAISLLAMTNLASAQVQRCTDSDGRVTFTDGICPKSSVNGKTLKPNQKYVGSESGSEKGQGPSLAEKNAAFNQRYRQAENDRTIREFMTTPLPPGVKYQRLTTYSDRPPKTESQVQQR